MIKPLITAAAVLVSTAALAAPAERTVTRDGQTYAYTVSNDKRGRTVLTGRNMFSGVAFRYVVDGSQVVGYTGNERVRFRIANPIPRAVPAADLIAAR